MICTFSYFLPLFSQFTHQFLQFKVVFLLPNFTILKNINFEQIHLFVGLSYAISIGIVRHFYLGVIWLFHSIFPNTFHRTPSILYLQHLSMITISFFLHLNLFVFPRFKWHLYLSGWFTLITDLWWIWRQTLGIKDVAVISLWNSGIYRFIMLHIDKVNRLRLINCLKGH